jgi:hypothetical protein
MKTPSVFLVFLLLVVCNACLSDNYFDKLNSAPEIETAINLSAVDSLKIGIRHNDSKNICYTLPITVTDRNYNLKSLILDIDDSFIITDKLGSPLHTYYDLNNAQHQGGLTEVFYLYPTLPGQYRINLTVIDKFNASSSIYKELYIFDNFPPKSVAKNVHYVTYQLINIIYLDLSASYDQDERWGGRIASYHALYHYSWDNEAFPMGSGGINTPYPWLLEISDFAWQPVGRIEAWVTDDEGAESEHINIIPVKR